VGNPRKHHHNVQERSISTLALLGGSKAINHDFRKYNAIGSEEVTAATRIVKSGVLSRYLGCWEPDFYGGDKVQEFENACAKYFGVKHAVTVNSWTSGLICAVGAIGIEPGDEVIVTPWTMCASATAILHWNAIPVFADIEPETFNLDPAAVEANITPYTKAIMAVDIFGHSCEIDALMALADKYDLKVITDTAQAPGALYKGGKTGTQSHIGGYSLNYHKHIHTGEGGVLVTNDDAYCERLQLIRNHAEAVVKDKGVSNLANMLGYNFRLGEIECGIGLEQLKKLDDKVAGRQYIADRLNKGLAGLTGLRLPVVKNDCTHAYYIYPLVIDTEILPVGREKLLKALTAEGIGGIGGGYVNVHLLPMYQEKIAYGSHGFPWTSDICKRDVDYAKGICPVAEQLHEKSFMGFEMCLYELDDKDIDAIISAFHKVWDNRDVLAGIS
jgi:perosamine synthetase